MRNFIVILTLGCMYAFLASIATYEVAILAGIISLVAFEVNRMIDNGVKDK